MMRGVRLLAIVAATAVLPSLGTAQPKPAAMGGEFMMQFESSMEKLIALAEAVPADKYGWSPAPGVMTVAKVYAHIAHYNYSYPAVSLGFPAPNGRDGEATEAIADKAQLVALLKDSRDHVRAAVKSLPPALDKTTTLYGRQVPQWSVLLQLVAHMNEHLGQSVAYARMNAIVPPWSR